MAEMATTVLPADVCAETRTDSPARGRGRRRRREGEEVVVKEDGEESEAISRGMTLCGSELVLAVAHSRPRRKQFTAAS